MPTNTDTVLDLLADDFKRNGSAEKLAAIAVDRSCSAMPADKNCCILPVFTTEDGNKLCDTLADEMSREEARVLIAIDSIPSDTRTDCQATPISTLDQLKQKNLRAYSHVSLELKNEEINKRFDKLFEEQVDDMSFEGTKNALIAIDSISSDDRSDLQRIDELQSLGIECLEGLSKVWKIISNRPYLLSDRPFPDLRLVIDIFLNAEAAKREALLVIQQEAAIEQSRSIVRKHYRKHCRKVNRQKFWTSVKESLGLIRKPVKQDPK